MFDSITRMTGADSLKEATATVIDRRPHGQKPDRRSAAAVDRMLGKLVFAAVIVTISTSAIAANKRRASAHRTDPAHAPARGPRPFDPKAYAASIEGVDCSNVAALASSIGPIEKPLQRIAQSYPYGPPTKGEFESTDAFDQRVRNELAAKFGGTDRIVAVIPIGDIMKYDADSSTLTIDPVGERVREKVIAVKAYSDISGESTYTGSNAYGASALISRYTFTEFYLLLPARGRTVVTSTMEPGLARSLKENGSLVIVGSLFSPYIAYERKQGRPTVNDPNDVTYLKFYLALAPQCAVVVNGGEEIARIAL